MNDSTESATHRSTIPSEIDSYEDAVTVDLCSDDEEESKEVFKEKG